MEEDRSELFNEIQKFSQRKLKKVETKVVTSSGDKLVEKRTAKGLTQSDGPNNEINKNSNRKLDLQIGLVCGGLIIGSDDVALCKKTLNDYAITHILNLAPNETEPFQFEDDFNYLEVKIEDEKTLLKDVYDKCFDFIEEGQQRGSCFVHCSTKLPGLSRSTAICIAYLIHKEKKNFQDAFNDVKEARAFVRPSIWFSKQLQEFANEQSSKKAEEQVEDKFTAKKRKEIEEEKAMLQKTGNLKNKKNLWNKQVEEEQKKQLTEQKQKEKLQANKLRSNFLLNNENNSMTNDKIEQTNGPRKLTSLMSIFQQKDVNAEKPLNKIVLNTAPVKKWAPVSTPHLQRTVRPETKNYDFYSKVKKTKSREFKNLKKTKSKASCVLNEKNIDINNNSEDKKEQKNVVKSSIPPPPPPPPLSTIKPISSQNSTLNSQKSTVNQKTNSSIIPPSQTLKKELILSKPQTIKSIPVPPPPPPQSLSTNDSKNKVLSPKVIVESSSKITPSPKINTEKITSATMTKPILKRETSLNKNFDDKKPITLQKKLDPYKISKFNRADSIVSDDKCLDYSSKVLNKNSDTNPIVRNIPIKIESKVEDKIKKEPTNELISEEVSEESCEEESSEEKSSEEESSGEESSEEESSEEESSEEDSSEEESSEEESSGEESSEEESIKQNVKNKRNLQKNKGLTRSSTMEILKLIKSKNNDNEKLQVVEEEDEDKEIDILLNGLQNEGIENIDWEELGIDLDEVKDILNQNQ